MESKGFTEARRCACGNVRRATRALTQFYDHYLQPSGLRVTQLSLLLNIAWKEKTTAGELADILIMDQTTVTRNLASLKKHGYISIGRETTDARKKIVAITPEGRAALAAAMPLWEKAQACIVGGLGQGRYREFLKTLAEISALSRG